MGHGLPVLYPDRGRGACAMIAAVSFQPLPRRPRQVLHLVALLVAALLAAQWLGVLHRVAHDPHRTLVAEPHPHHGHGERDPLFGAHEEGDTVCQLLDALTPDHPLQPLPPGLPAGLQAVVAVFSHADFIARRVALFDARGPPASR